MTKSLPKLVLSSSRDIPFSQLVLSQKNVRRVKAGLSIEDLADDIYHRTLLQSLNVRAMLDDDGKETGMFEVPAGGRRFRALELLVKSKRMAKDQPVPCVVREGGIAEEDSLAENVMRVGLHPLDQYRAFSALIEAGLLEEDIAARFFVSVSTVRQRLRLGVTGQAVEARIANAANDPTFLLAEVDVVATYKLYNINRTRLEGLIHRALGPARLDLSAGDRFGKKVQPREWFLVPLSAIDELVAKISDGTVTEYHYDPERARFVPDGA